MKIFNSPKAAFAILLAAILICVSTSLPSAKAEVRAHEVDLLMVYDESFTSFLNDKNLTGTATERIDQMMKLAAIPFRLQWSVYFNWSIDTYADTLGTDPAVSCLSMHPFVDENLDSPTREWNYSALCTCHGLTHQQHHSRGGYYTAAAYNYATNQYVFNPYDDVGIITAHGICHERTIDDEPDHYEIGGLGKVSAPGFIVSGKQSMGSSNTDPYHFLNWLWTKYAFAHEISHNFGAHDGYNSTSCTADCPCVMNTGFQSVIYVRDYWCPDCHIDFTPGTFD